jgi:hypothetical protein
MSRAVLKDMSRNSPEGSKYKRRYFSAVKTCRA